MEAKVTISRNSKDEISIKIEDGSSGLRIIDVRMTPRDFAMCVTGLSHCPATIEFRPTQFTVDNIGKKREVKSIFVDKPNTHDREKRRVSVRQQIEESGELVDGWMIHGDGCDTQQNGDKHCATLYRFVEADPACD